MYFKCIKKINIMIIKIIKNEINRNKIVYVLVYLYICCLNDLYMYLLF